MNKLISNILQLGLHAYRIILSPLLPFITSGGCRYYPTCSSYSMEAIESHGAIKGSWLTIKRVIRCHPWARHGVDPVPQKLTEPRTSK